ncbi:MAG: hypothetical protein ACI8Q1_001221 [Parvicella sp.]|jgi:hypothetical protein
MEPALHLHQQKTIIMKKTLQLLGTFAIISILAAACGTAETPKDESTSSEKIEENVTKKVKAEINDAGEATVTITTITNGTEAIEVLTGAEALTYLEEEKLNENAETSGTSKIIIEKQDADGENIDIEEIMDAEEIKELDVEIQTKIKEGLEEANSDIEITTEKKTKVIVIEK